MCYNRRKGKKRHLFANAAACIRLKDTTSSAGQHIARDQRDQRVEKTRKEIVMAMDGTEQKIQTKNG